MKSPRVVKKLIRHPVFNRRVRHYHHWIAEKEGRPQTAERLIQAIGKTLDRLLENPQRGRPAGFQDIRLKSAFRITIAGFEVFAMFYTWDCEVLTLLTVEHTSQDLATRLASVFPEQS